MTIARAALCTALLVSVSTAGCQLERLFPDQVGVGVARLTVRNAATLVGLVSDDDKCGFASPDVKYNYVVDGEIGGFGSVTWTVTECELDFGKSKKTGTNCNDVDTTVGGKVIVNGLMKVSGRLTGEPDTPVIPDHPDAAQIDISARFTDFFVGRSDSESVLTVRKGALTYTARPPIAVSISDGVCGVATANIAMDDLQWTDAVVEVNDGTRAFEVDVPESKYSVQLGKYNGKENWINGTIRVWDVDVKVPGDDESQGLDPEYERGKYLNSYSCTDDLQLPITYECPALTPKFAQGVAQLSIKTFGNLMKIVDADENCGFSSTLVESNPTLTGNVGYAGGVARYRIDNPCRIDLDVPVEIGEDCNGKITYAQGTIIVTGSKTISGILVGAPDTPVVPTDTLPAVITLEAELENYNITDTVSTNSLFVKHGFVSGTGRPQTAIDESVGACAFVTPIVTFENVTLRDAETQLNSSGKTFDVAVQSTTLQAQNGKRGDNENLLVGEITIDGQDFAIPHGDDTGLDPDYDPAVFLSSYACEENLRIPDSDDDCSVTTMLAEGASSLIIQTAGKLASMVNGNDDCGYENTFVLLAPDLVLGEPGEMGSMTWSIDDCSVGSDEVVMLDESCTGGRTFVEGWANIDSTRTVRGERETQLLLIDSIVPRDRESVDVYLDNVELDGLSIYSISAGASEPLGTLKFHSGTLSALVQPIMGERASAPGTFDVATPVAKMTDVIIENGVATLISEGKRFEITIGYAQLTAQNGSWEGASNEVVGTVVLNGETVDIGPMDLDPGFEQTAFDSSYVCTEDLLSVVPSQ